MNRNLLIFLALTAFCTYAKGQSFKVYGKITNNRLEPLAFASIQVKEWNQGTISKENGMYELLLEQGKYDLVISMVGFKTQIITVIVQKADYIQNVIMEPNDSAALSAIIIKGKAKDRSEEIIRHVIQNKETIQAAAGAYSCHVYIKAVQEDSTIVKRKKKPVKADTASALNKNADLDKMAMTEVLLQLDHAPQGIKEQRLGVTQKDNTPGLFYLSTTDGDFSLYNNLIKAPVVSATPFLSPISYSGLLAYRFKMIRTEKKDGHKIYVISVKPRQISNATVEGELTIADSLWVILHARFRLPAYHLPEYDFFEVDQQYQLIADTAWMLSRQQFTYYSKINKAKTSGTTTAAYTQYELHKQFEKKHFGVEVSAATTETYERDSNFWKASRTEPLTPKELRFIHYKDSIYHATHTKDYLDSVDRATNKITWKKWFWSGQEFHNHEKEQTWFIAPLPSLYQPLQYGGTRIEPTFSYTKIYPSRKMLVISPSISYGIRNHDINGDITLTKMYNPFNRGFFKIEAERDFEYIYEGDAWINLLKRSNFYLDNSIGIEHGLEIKNGLFLYTDLDVAFRRSVSDYKTNSLVDTLFDNILTNNHAIAFEPYNATYGKIKLQYTPGQRYIREPKEKIILGSAWPTFYGTWRKGIPGPLNSKVDFDYLEFGIEQEVKLGLLGTSTYNIKTGNFFNTKDLRLIDYQFQRRGDPLLFMNPKENFQALDSTFALFHRYYQGHFIHDFNGALINKIPILKNYNCVKWQARVSSSHPNDRYVMQKLLLVLNVFSNGLLIPSLNLNSVYMQLAPPPTSFTTRYCSK